MSKALRNIALASCITVASGCDNNARANNTEQTIETTSKYVENICSLKDESNKNLRILKSRVELKCNENNEQNHVEKEHVKLYREIQKKVDDIAKELGVEGENLVRSIEYVTSIKNNDGYSDIVNDVALSKNLTPEQISKIKLTPNLSNYKEVFKILFDDSFLEDWRRKVVDENGVITLRKLTLEELEEYKKIYIKEHKRALKKIKQIKKHSTQKLPTKEKPNPKPAPYSEDALEKVVTLFNNYLNNPSGGIVKLEIARRNLLNSLSIAEHASVKSDIFKKNEKYYSGTFFKALTSDITEYLMTTTTQKEGNSAIKIEIGFKKDSLKYLFPTQEWVNELPIKSDNFDDILEFSLLYLKEKGFKKSISLSYENKKLDTEILNIEERILKREGKLEGIKQINSLIDKAQEYIKKGNYKEAKIIIKEIIDIAYEKNIYDELSEGINILKKYL